MPVWTKLFDTLLILLLLGSGSESYALLSAFSSLPHAADLMIAMSLRMASVVCYRFYARVQVLHDTPLSPMRLLFEWFIPVVVIAELMLTICIFPFGALCVQSNPWVLILILIGLDFFTFFLLASILDPRTCLGPYGAFHISIIEGCSTLNTVLLEPAPNPDPSNPVTSDSDIPAVNSVSTSQSGDHPPPYTTYDPSKYGPILELV